MLYPFPGGHHPTAVSGGLMGITCPCLPLGFQLASSYSVSNCFKLPAAHNPHWPYETIIPHLLEMSTFFTVLREKSFVIRQKPLMVNDNYTAKIFPSRVQSAFQVPAILSASALLTQTLTVCRLGIFFRRTHRFSPADTDSRWAAGMLVLHDGEHEPSLILFHSDDLHV